MSGISRALTLSAGLVVLISQVSCNFQPSQDGAAPSPLPTIVSAKARSNHYVDVKFATPTGAEATVAGNYTIVAPDGSTLPVLTAEAGSDPQQILLTTDSQQNLEYQLIESASLTTQSLTSTLDLLVGSVGFVGSPIREPFIESAVSLGNTSVLVSFSERVDREFAETIGFYRIADPDGNADIDISIVGAALEPDGTSVILATTPQANIAYRITTTNVKSRFTCEDGERIILDSTSSGQPELCTTAARAILTTEGEIAPFVLSARQNIATNAPLNPDAAGQVAEVTTSPCGAGVDCSSSQRDITGTGSDANEELIFTLDRSIRADRFILGLNEIDFNLDEPVLFASSDAASGFDLTIERTALSQAYVGEAADRGRVFFESLPSFAGNLRIDKFKIRETNRAFCVNSLCITDGRRVDPTRNTVGFQGIPPVDIAGPFVDRALATGNRTVAIFFNEPLGGEPADAANFSIFPTSCQGQVGCPELIITDVALTAHGTQIILNTLPQIAGVEYTVTVSNVVDLTGNSIGNPNFATFDSLTPLNLSPPRVVGAISTSNTSFIVTFNKPMGDSALVVSNYVVVQVNLNSEVGTIGLLGNRCDADSDNSGEACTDDSSCPNGTCLLSPRFLGPDRTAVEIRTTSQNEVTYQVIVVNVRDLEGNQMAPPEILVNPSTAEFPGTPPSGGDIVDTDGDGLSDNEETRGYLIVIARTGGETDSFEVTSDPTLADTDGDGLTDFDERARFSDPRSADTDKDGLSDFDEVWVWGTSLTNQDTDGDTLGDNRELTFFKTSPIFADTDGDGLQDNLEILLGNRDPRIADLPDPGISIGQISLRLDTRFAFTDTQGQSSSVEKSTSATLSQSDSKTFSTSDSSTNQHAIEASAEFALESGTSGVKKSGKVGLSYGYTRENTFTASESSTRETQQQFQESLTTSVSRDVSQAVTRTVEGASVQVLVTIDSGSDIPFTVRNIELTGLLQDPFDRSSFQPVATLIPASELLGSGGLEVSLGPFVQERGPFVFENREIFPSLVEDLMKNPRGLIFKVANFDIVDEAGRNFTFLTQDVNDRTVGLIIDFGTGEVERIRASTHSRFDLNACDAVSDNRGEFCRSDADCPNGSCDFSTGAPIGVSMAFVLQDILRMKKNERENAITIGPNGCGETAAIGDDIQVVAPICPPVVRFGDIILAGPNGILNAIPVGDDEKDPTGTKIIDGGDGCAHTRAARDDIQVVPGRCETAFPDGIMVLPGPNGTFETPTAGDDEKTTVTGYETEITGICNGDTSVSIVAGPNMVLDTSVALGDDTIFATQVLPGPNSVIETSPQGDDILQGPGLGCNVDLNCPGGLCQAVEQLVRVKGVRNNLEESRFWIIFSPKDIPPDVNFDDILMQSGDVFSLAFVQDRDGDGLIAREEFLYGSSDLDDNTDGCPFDDGDERCGLFDLEFDTVLDFDEVRKGWEIDVVGQRNFFSFPNPVLPDTDADGLFDDEEQSLGTDPGKRDTDDDEVQDNDEVRGYEILRRDGLLIRNVEPYQSAIITPGANSILDTSLVFDDVIGLNLASQAIITPGPDGEIDSIPEGDDVLETTELILDGGDGEADTFAVGDDVAVGGVTPGSSSKVAVSFLSFDTGGDACDQLLPGEYSFDFSLRNGSGVVANFTESAVVSRGTPHLFRTNSNDVFLARDETMTMSITIREDDPQCNSATRRAVVEPLAYIVDGGNGMVETLAHSADIQLIGVGERVNPNDPIIVSGADAVLDTVSTGGDDRLVGAYIIEPFFTVGFQTANTEVPMDSNMNPLNDDIQEVTKNALTRPGQVIISPGPNGILDTAPAGNDIVPLPNGFGDTIANGDDQQVVGLAQRTKPGQFIVLCGGDGEPDAMIANGMPGICAESGTTPARRPDACAPVIRQPLGGSGIAETSAFGDDEQLIDVGSFAAAGAVVIGPGINGMIDSRMPDFYISPGTNLLLDSTRLGDDIIVGQSIFPGPDNILNSALSPDDVLVPADDQFEAAVVPAGLDCTMCPLGSCVFNCSLCPAGNCVADDVLLVRGSADDCGDGVCPCGSCLTGIFGDEVTFSLDLDLDQIKLLQLIPTPFPIENQWFISGFLPGDTQGRNEIRIRLGDVFTDCFSSSRLEVDLDLTFAAKVESGTVLVRPGLNGVLDSTPLGDDVIGAPHLTVFATDPLNRDTDGDGLFDGAEAALGANPNDATDASKFRDNDLDGLVNIVEDDGWFIGYSDATGLFCMTERQDGDKKEKFIRVLDEFNPPFGCITVTPDRFEPDTDFDGLPDLLEMLIRSDPTSEDTDGDGLLDLDEFDSGSLFSVSISNFREFTRRCLDAQRCTFSPVDEPFGTSVSRADTDQDGRDDRAEIFDDEEITVCFNGIQTPVVVTSDPLSADGDRDGVLDGAEIDQGTDPRNFDTDGDLKSDNPKIDPQPNGCGKTFTVTVNSFMTGDDDCDGGALGDGDFIFSITINFPPGKSSAVSGSANMGSNKSFTFGSNQVTFILRPGEEFNVTGLVNEKDGSSGDENWDLGTIIFKEIDFNTGTFIKTIAPSSPGSGAADSCYDGASITLTITVGPA